MPFGPDGGDARRFASDPQDPAHLYLGTATGWLFESRNSGATWKRLARPGKRDDLVLDGIVVDPTNPKHLLVAGFVLGAADGGVFISYDGGATWISQAEMRGLSVLSLTAAPSDPRILVAGTLRGVYRSTDGGQRWKLISPPDSTEIHNIQSVAIDPVDPAIIYAGTWHLPWKTTDAGENWANIKQGILEDSDVFSIIVDPISPNVVYASACSGIYKSEDAGGQFRRIEGIPKTAIRTRVLRQDPQHLEIVFAGTTEGLFRTEDAGRRWKRKADADVIVNDVYVDRRDGQRVLVATDRAGVLASDDGGETFHPSNAGFSARQITALKRDQLHPATLYVGVVNDKTWGGVFQSEDGGINWQQRSSGLDGRDVFSLGQAPDGTMIAGTSHGLFRLNANAEMWDRVENSPGEGNPALPEEKVQMGALAARPPVPVGRNEFRKRTGLREASVHSAKATLSSIHGGKGRQAKGTRMVPKPAAGAAAKRAVHPRGIHLVKAHGATTTQREAGRVRSVATNRRPAPVVPAAPRATVVEAPPLVRPKGFDGAVVALATADKVLLAATSGGLLTSSDDGQSWTAAGPEGSADWRYLAAAKRNVVAASLRAMLFSPDSGETWTPVKLPEGLTMIASVAVEPSGEIWVGGREGVFVSPDGGSHWTTPKNLYVRSVTSIYFDEASNRVLLSATAGGSTDIAFQVQLPEKSITYAETGWNLRFVRPVGDHLVGVTLFDGIVIQPKMMAAPLAASETARR